MTKTKKKYDIEKDTGWLIDCYLKPHNPDKPMFYGRKDGTIVAMLRGYAIIPRKEYEALTRKK